MKRRLAKTRSRMGRFGRQLRSPVSKSRPSFPLQLEPLEARYLLHGGAEGPEGEHTVNDTIQAELLLYVDGQQVDVPQGIGFSSGNRSQFVGTTATNSLTIGPFDSQTPSELQTLGDFFDIWRLSAGDAGNNPDAVVTATQLLDSVADENRALKMFVNGQDNMSFDDYVIENNDVIVLTMTSQPVVTLHTNFGSIPIQLLEGAPGSAHNFLNYASDGDYDNSIFHRSVPGFVVQGGGFTTSNDTFQSTAQLTPVPTDPPIQNEFGRSNTRGTVAFAKLGGNPDSATSQYFFNLGDNSNNLDNQNGGFTVFGEVLDLSAVDVIAGLDDSNFGSPFDNLPLGANNELVVVQSVSGSTRSVSGILFSDVNRNGVQDAGEDGLAGVTVYSDENNNNVPDANEFSTTTEADGSFQFDLQFGTHNLKHTNTAFALAGEAFRAVEVKVGGSDPVVTMDARQLATPDAPDLLSDTGTPDDNLTNRNNRDAANTLEFRVTNVEQGATVQIVDQNGTVFGSEVATSSEVVVTTFGTQQLADGSHTFQARQLLNGATSPDSNALSVAIDTTLAEITSTPPADATLGVQFTYDADHPDEGTTGFRYSLQQAPDGVVIDPISGVITWTPIAAQLGSQSFSLNVTDVVGNTRQQLFDVEVGGEVIVSYTTEIRNLNGELIQEANIGDRFILTVFGEDTRQSPRGLFTMALDVLYDAARVRLIGPVQFDSRYEQLQVGDTSTPGVIDEVVASTLGESGGGVETLFSAEFEAIGSGTAALSADAADNLPFNDTLVWGLLAGVPVPQILYGSSQLNIALTFDPQDDTATVAEDSGSTVIDVLNNDTILSGSAQDLMITEVGATSNGGTVTIASDGRSLSYQPANDFFGTDTFTYTASKDGGQDQATVTVTVTPTNDAPIAVDDTATVVEDSDNNNINLTANDLLGPDTGETLVVGSVDATSQQGGTVTIGSDNRTVDYSPADDFIGTDTFQYTVSDGNGGFDTATVTVEVVEQNDPPIANDDSFTVFEDSQDNVADPLQNDSTGPDTQEVLTIESVGTPNQGGSISIVQNGTMLSYTPATNFFGTETVTYTISDGRGGTDQATATFTVVAQGDPPIANPDDLVAVLDTPIDFFVLANDSIMPDINETLRVIAVSNGDQGGTLSISQDGQLVRYTPATGFVGQETFNYTIEDSSGESAQGTATVTVREFTPSTLAGFVYFDVDNNGQKGAPESGIGGITVTLEGTDDFGESVMQTAVTQADGSYQFTQLAPGSYTVRQAQPSFVIDGIDTPGSAGGTSTTNDEIMVQLAEGTTATDYNFGELGRSAEFISITDCFSSTAQPSMFIASNDDGTLAWYSYDEGWDGFRLDAITSDSSLNQLRLEYNNPADEQVATEVQELDPNQLRMVGRIGDQTLVRLNGASSDFQFEPANGAANNGTGGDSGAEGEAGVDSGDTPPATNSTPPPVVNSSAVTATVVEPTGTNTATATVAVPIVTPTLVSTSTSDPSPVTTASAIPLVSVFETASQSVGAPAAGNVATDSAPNLTSSGLSNRSTTESLIVTPQQSSADDMPEAESAVDSRRENTSPSTHQTHEMDEQPVQGAAINELLDQADFRDDWVTDAETWEDDDESLDDFIEAVDALFEEAGEAEVIAD